MEKILRKIMEILIIPYLIFRVVFISTPVIRVMWARIFRIEKAISSTAAEYPLPPAAETKM